jgi:hypothetical protein
MDDGLHFSTPNEARNRFNEIITFIAGFISAFSFSAERWRQGRRLALLTGIWRSPESKSNPVSASKSLNSKTTGEVISRGSVMVKLWVSV